MTSLAVRRELPGEEPEGSCPVLTGMTGWKPIPHSEQFIPAQAETMQVLSQSVGVVGFCLRFS